MTTPQERAWVWLNSLIAAGEAEDWERASGAVVMIYDPTTGHHWFHGPFPGAALALEFAEKHATELNSDPDLEKDFRVTVHPMWSPEQG